MTTKPVLTVADVAELIGHPDPTSASAGVKVGRLVKMGLPYVPGVKPRLFLFHQVMSWLEGQTTVYDPQNPPTEKPKRRRRRKAKPLGTGTNAALEDRINRLHSEVQRAERA